MKPTRDAEAASSTPAPRRVLFVAGRTHVPNGVVPPHGSGAHVAATRAGLQAHFDVVSILGPPPAEVGNMRSRARRFVPGWLRGLRQDVLVLAAERRLAAQAFQAVSEAPPDAVYERSEYLSFAGLRVARRLGVPYVLEVDGLVTDDVRTQYRSPVEPLGRRVERVKQRHAASIVVESPGMAAALEQRGADPAKIVVAPNALPADRVRSAPRAIRADRAVVGWIGHLMPWYVDAISLLVEVAPRVIEAVPNVRFEIVAGGPGLATLQALVAERGLTERFRLRGAVPYEQVPSVLEELDVGVIPALFDYQLPVKLVEMGGAGLPVVAPATTSLDGLLARGVEYEAFEPGDVDGLVRALVRVCGDPAVRDRLGRALLEAVRTRFTWPVVSEQLAGAVRRACAAPSAT